MKAATATPLPAMAHTIAEAADLLRFSTRHIRRLISTGELRARKAGRRVLILPADLDRYLESLPAAVAS